MLADLFLIEVLQTSIPGIMKKYHDKHYFSLGHGEITVIITFCGKFKRIF